MPEFKSSRSYWDFARHARQERRFIRAEEDEEFLRTLIATSDHRISNVTKGTIFWRAQIGHGWRSAHQDDEYMGEIPAPHPPERMKPQPGKAYEGRANPKGIPYLYLATTKETAMSEVRPWIGSLISVSQFKVLHDLSIMDCSIDHRSTHFYFEEPDAKAKERAVWSDIDRAFSAPVDRSDNAAEYIPTQIIAELFRSEGSDGIAYKSPFGEKGYNVVLFDITAADLINCFLYEAKAVNIDFEETETPYFVKKYYSEKAK